MSSSYAATCRKLHRLQGSPFRRFVRLIQQTNGWGVLPAKTLRVSWRIHRTSLKLRGRFSFSQWLKATGQSLATHRNTGPRNSATTKPEEER